MCKNDKEFEQAIARVTCSVWGPSMGRRMNQRDLKQRQQIADLKAELDAVLAMVSMLEEKEWAEHAGRGPISNRLEACITELHGEISEAHEAALATQPAAGEPVASGVNYAEEVDLIRAVLEGYSPSIARSDALCSVKLLKSYFAAPPAAAHGDEAVLDVLKTAYESGYQDGQDAPNAYSDEKVKHRVALSLLEEMMADAAMRTQAGEGGE